MWGTLVQAPEVQQVEQVFETAYDTRAEYLCHSHSSFWEVPVVLYCLNYVLYSRNAYEMYLMGQENLILPFLFLGLYDAKGC